MKPLIVLLATLFFANSVMAESESDKMDALLAKAASIANKDLPIMVDSETRLDNTIGGNYRVVYNYTLVNYQSEEIDPNELKSIYQETIKNKSCTTPMLIPYFKHGVSIYYQYYGNKGKFITAIKVSPDDCRNI